MRKNGKIQRRARATTAHARQNTHGIQNAIDIDMKIEKRVTRNTRRINLAIRTIEMLREEVNSYTEELDELNRRIDILYAILKEER